MLEITGSPFWVGLVNAAWTAPILVFSMAGGLLADKFSRRKILMASELANLVLYLALAVLVWAQLADRWLLIFFSLATGVAFALTMPARQAIIPDLVERRDLVNAIALTTTVFSTAMIIGPAIAGFIIAAWGTAASFFVIAAVAVPIVILLQKMRAKEGMGLSRGVSILRNFQEGLTYVRKSAIITLLMLIGAVITVFSAPYQAMLPVLAKESLKMGAEGLGLLTGAAGIGSLVGAFLFAILGETRPKGQLMVISGAGFGLFIALTALSPWLIPSMLLIGVAGLSSQVFFTSNFTLVQTSVTDELRGRVLSIRMIIFGLQPVGQIMEGIIAELTNAPLAVSLGGGISLALVLLLALQAPQLRRMN